MADPPFSKEECKKRREAIRESIKKRVDFENQWGVPTALTADEIFKKLVDVSCCKGEQNGCDCDQVAQYCADQADVIAKLERYIAADDFTTFPAHSVIATSGPAGIRPKDACCCIKKAIEAMEAYTTSNTSDFAPTFTDTFWAGIYMYGLLIKGVWTGDRKEYNKAHAEIELGRSRAFRNMLLDIYALCCCEN
jgi:hypothetical protein